MRPGTYRDKDGKIVVVKRTATGYTIKHADGRVTVIGGR